VSLLGIREIWPITMQYWRNPPSIITLNAMTGKMLQGSLPA
jgi:hypothetical protein